jgi:hypothetical protein
MCPELGPARPPEGAGPRPAEVDRAFRLWTGCGAFAGGAQIILWLRPAGPASSAGVSPEVGVAAVATAVWVLLGLLVRSGRNWARVLCALWAVLYLGFAALLFLQWRAPQPASVTDLLFSLPLPVLIVAALLSVVAAAFMFRPAVSRYISARKRASRAGAD